jgi:exosortase/archaeosortase family protein
MQPTQSAAPNRSLPFVRLAVFLALFFALQAAWTAARGSAVERWLIEGLIVPSAAGLANLLPLGVAASAAGARLQSSEGSLNVLNGCEGTDVLFLLVAAFAVAPLSLRARLAGVAVGAAVVFALNQVRILVLLQAVRHEPQWFGVLHSTVTPLALTAGVAVFFLLWLRRAEPQVEGAAPARG